MNRAPRQYRVIPMPIDTEELSRRYREQAVNLAQRRLLVTRFVGTEQEKDLSEPPNCGGYGRIRHFRRDTRNGWPLNALPIEPACEALGIPSTDHLRAQVFQNAVCNWRCWYCFVPFDLLSANLEHSGWLTPAELVDLYMAERDRPKVIDLTGGQPDLVPEWVPWMMQELVTRGLEDQVYLWSDDNLSNDYFWKFLSNSDRELVATYRRYGRVCCFKGYSTESFAFNTSAHSDLFDQQFVLMKRLISLGIDIYAYVTLTSCSSRGVVDDIARFVDRLQSIAENLPLRTVPLLIQEFTPVTRRLNTQRKIALDLQQVAVEAWQKELEARFSSHMRALSIAKIPLW